MMNLKSVFILLCFAVVSGCAAPFSSSDRRVTVADDLGAKVCVSDVRWVKGSGGYTTFQVNVVNTTSDDLGVEWKVVWLDAQGIAYDTLVSSWNKLMLLPGDVTALRNTSPSKDAADARIYIRRLR